MIRLLLVEDEPPYVLLLREMLAHIPDSQFEVAEEHSLAGAIRNLAAHRHDTILLDLGLPDSYDLHTLTALRAVVPHTPIIVVSASHDELMALQAVQAGAQDYLIKGTFTPLALHRVIQYAVERQGILRALDDSERQYRALVEQASDSIFISTADGTLLDVNSQGCVLLGYSRTEMLGMSVNRLLMPVGVAPPAESLADLMAGKTTRYEVPMVRQDGSMVSVELASKMLDDGRIQSIARDITERKRAEDELRQREETLSAVWAASSDAMAFSDTSGLVLKVNPAYCALYGYAEAELVGQSFTIIYPPQDRAYALACYVARFQQQASDVTTETTVQHSDGSSIVVDVRYDFTTHDGHRTGMLSTSRDVTARKKAEERQRARIRHEGALAALGQQALVASDVRRLMERGVAVVADALQAEFCAVLELLPDGKELLLSAGAGWQPGLVGAATMDNDSASQVGYTLRAEGMVIVEDLRREPRFSGPGLLLDHAVVSGISIAIRTPAGPFGILGAYSTSPRIFTHDDFNIIGAVANILATAIGRDRAERALRSGERQFRAVFDNTIAAIFIVDDERRFIKANPAAARLIDIAQEQLIGMRMDDIIDLEQAPLLDPAWRSFLADGRMDGEYTIPRTDGSTRIIQLESTANMLPDQHLLSMIDITERKQAEEERLVQQKTQAANQAKNDFLSQLSHELRTPLHAIMGYSQLLEMGNLEGEDREVVELIIGAGKHLLNLINEVLDISTMESGNLTLSPELLTLDEVLTESLLLIAPTAALHDITIRSEVAGLDQLPVLADRHRLRQVLLNLLSNAVKYNSEGGAIVVSYQGDPDYLSLMISDTGPGIAADKIGLLFTPFERLGVNSYSVEGTGLGLAICKQLIKAMNGQIGAESVPGEGSTFWIRLPLVTAEQILL